MERLIKFVGKAMLLYVVFIITACVFSFVLFVSIGCYYTDIDKWMKSDGTLVWFIAVHIMYVVSILFYIDDEMEQD